MQMKVVLPAFVAADLLSQAEHGSDSQVVIVTNLVATIEASTTGNFKAIGRVTQKRYCH